MSTYNRALARINAQTRINTNDYRQIAMFFGRQVISGDKAFTVYVGFGELWSLSMSFCRSVATWNAPGLRYQIRPAMMLYDFFYSMLAFPMSQIRL